MDQKEEGEVSDGDGDSFDLAYKPVVRPNASQYRTLPRHLPSSDEDYSSDSDSDINAIKKKKNNVSKMETSLTTSEPQKGWPPDSQDAMKAFLKPKRRNNIWSTVMQEQVLSQEIGGFGLKRRLDRGERSVESYDYAQARKMREMLQSDEEEGNGESEDNKKKRFNRKRHIKERGSYANNEEDDHPRELIDLKLTDEATNEEVGIAMANGLFESKPEIIIRAVDILGREKCMELYKETQELERKGGLMILDGSRRRTSGGVFLLLLRKLPDVDKADMNKIFLQEEQWRKRKRAHRKRERHESKPQGEDRNEEGLHLGGLFSDDPGGAKCPGTTPVTSPQPSDNEDDLPPSSTINKLSPSVMLDPLPTPPPSVSDPRALKSEGFESFKEGQDHAVALDPRAATTQSYDEDFLLDNHTADAMELF